ncbi:putative isomerase BH0283 [Vitis vinifera]|uniref:Putative isomerase BH0283 n=1 Tax=Vitis vinifera TaxID=29760 RepID=A0A438F4N6_VITVI|nr:putative isomerase BH0283 [Vitis vinifera]
MAKKPVKFSVLNAFTETAFKGNPAAVCLLEEERSGMVAGQGFGITENTIPAELHPSFMAKKPVKFTVVDAFTDSAFKGNPAAVCLLEEERDEDWLQALAMEFNISETCYLNRITEPEALDSSTTILTPRFRLRWFTPVAEVNLCGHATLAAAHFLFTSRLVNGNLIEFITLSGVLTARKVMQGNKSDALEYENGEAQEHFSIELDFPIVPMVEYNSAEVASISKALNGASVIDIKKTEKDDLFDPVCGSAYCSLAPYWSQKLGKCDLLAYAASPRSGIVDIHLDEQNQRVLLRGKAVTVMEGCVLV